MDVSQLNEKLRKIKKEIQEIQNNCTHKKQEIKFIKNYEIRWVCKKCNMALGWPSENESKNWLR